MHTQINMDMHVCWRTLLQIVNINKYTQWRGCTNPKSNIHRTQLIKAVSILQVWGAPEWPESLCRLCSQYVLVVDCSNGCTDERSNPEDPLPFQNNFQSSIIIHLSAKNLHYNKNHFRLDHNFLGMV